MPIRRRPLVDAFVGHSPTVGGLGPPDEHSHELGRRIRHRYERTIKCLGNATIVWC